MDFSRRGFLLLMLVLIGVWDWQIISCEAVVGTFGYDIHHRYSNRVKGILGLNGLPEEGSLDYYSALAHRDLLLRGRRLAADYSLLTFRGGNTTFQLQALGSLHYAVVSVGTPIKTYLVALDTGSNLFWIPCNCANCKREVLLSPGEKIDLNIYNLNESSTSMIVPCNSTFCGQGRRQCSATRNACAYQIEYLSNDTTTGILVEDNLNLVTDDTQLTNVDARITFGCGMIQTGLLLDGGAVNGLFGLGMDNISVPSILASQGLVANSFSMCFGSDGFGKIVFGDKGTSDQGETPFNIGQLPLAYNISVTQISLEKNVTDLNFTAIFDSGTSFTYLNDPAYTILSESFNSQIQEKRHQPNSRIPFDYCYDLSANQTTYVIPDMNLTMQGGDKFFVSDSTVLFSVNNGSGFFYCLGVIKSDDINIIGQNFMTGYRIVFDREKMVLGWKRSNCSDAYDSNTPPVTAPPPPIAPAAPPRNRSGLPVSSPQPQPSPPPPPPPARNHSPRTNPVVYALLAVIFTLSIPAII